MQASGLTFTVISHLCLHTTALSHLIVSVVINPLLQYYVLEWWLINMWEETFYFFDQLIYTYIEVTKDVFVTSTDTNDKYLVETKPGISVYFILSTPPFCQLDVQLWCVCLKWKWVTYWFGLDFFGIEGLEELRVALQFQALLCYSEVAHAVLWEKKNTVAISSLLKA